MNKPKLTLNKPRLTLNKHKDWRTRITYPEPNITYNINDYYPTFVVNLIEICSNEDTNFFVGKDLEKYVVVRLEIGPEDEDGVLVFLQVLDVYLLVFGMKGHGVFQFRDVVDGGSLFGFKEQYKTLGELCDVEVGVNVFNKAIKDLVTYFRLDDEDVVSWKVQIMTVSVFVAEAVRNKYILYDGYKRTAGCVSPWSPDLIHNWEACSKKAYLSDPQKPVKLSPEELRLIECLAEFDAKIVQQYSTIIKDSPPVCSLMLPIKWDHLAKFRLWKHHLDSILTPSKKGLKLDVIESRLKTRLKQDYKFDTCRLKNIMWELIKAGKVEYSRGYFTKKAMKGKSKTAHSSRNRKRPLNLLLIGNSGVGKSSLKDTLIKDGAKNQFETEDRLFTVYDVNPQVSYPENIHVCILVTSSLKGEFEALIDDEMTSKHVCLANSLKVPKILIAVDRMDDPVVDWSSERFHLIVKRMRKFLKGYGYKKQGLKFIPISGHHNVNVRTRVDGTICTWFHAMTLIEELDTFEVPSS